MFSNPRHITGKWNGKTYAIEKELGRGANGTVYLVRDQGEQGKPYAIKVGEDSFSITSEVNVLKHFAKAQGSILGPSLYDVDDWVEGGETRSFYTMNVIQGSPLLQFVENRGKEWVPIFMMQLLGFLEELHQAGWVFGDLKPDNLHVAGQPPKMAWFDAGGITKLGRAIKEYTELYDRGYWQMGNRKAEPSYDLFSVGMIYLYLHQGRALQPADEPKSQLQQVIFEDSSLYPYQQVIWKALTGTYTSASAMKKELVQAWHVQKGGRIKPKERKNLRRSKKIKKRIGWSKVISFFFFSSFLIFLFALYLFSQSL
jgi:serine/threonine-protein kinase